MKPHSRSVLAFFLSVQISLGSLPLSASVGDHQPSPSTPSQRPVPPGVGSPFTDGFEQEVADLEQSIQKSVEETPTPRLDDILHMTSEFHRKYVKNPKGSGFFTVGEDLSLNDVSMENEKISVLNPMKELRLRYDDEKKELEFIRITHDKKTGEEIWTDSHVMKNIELTAQPLTDPNFVYFSTKEGIHLLPWFQVLDAFCMAPFFAPAIIKIPGYRITELLSLSRNVKPEELAIRQGDGEFTDRHKEFDLAVHLQNLETGKVHGERFTRAELLSQYRMYLAFFLRYLQATNPDIMEADAVQTLVQEELYDKYVSDRQRTALLDETPSDPKYDVVLRALAAHGQIVGLQKYIALMKKDPSGKDALAKLAEAPRDIFPASAAPDSRWAQDHNRIQVTAGVAEQYGLNKTWKELLIDSYEHRDPRQLEAEYQYQSKLQHNLLFRWQEKFRKLATPTVLRRTAYITSAVVGGFVADRVSGGAASAWTAAVFLRVLDWSTRVPVLGALTADMNSAIHWFNSPAHIAETAIGFGLMAALNPLSYFLAGRAARMKGYAWSSTQALFSFGIQIYAKAARPIQKIILDKMGYGGFYNWIDNNLDPTDHPEAMKAFDPRAKREARENALRPETMTAVAYREITRKAKALLLAAAIVSRGSEETSTPVDIGTLLLAGRQEQVKSLLQLSMSAPEDASWQEATLLAYKGLADLGDSGGEPVTPETLAAHVAVYTQVCQDLQKHASGTSKEARSFSARLKVAFQNGKRFLSHQALSFALFGSGAYKNVFQKYRNAEVDADTTQIAKRAYNKDYVVSALYFAGIAPDAFAAIPFFGRSGWRIDFDQFAQVFIYGLQGAVDPLSNTQEALLENPSQSISEMQLSANRNRSQTLTEGLRSVWNQYLGDNRSGFCSFHAQCQINMLEGLQPRFFVDSVTRLFGLALTGIGTYTVAQYLGLPMKVFALSNVYLFSKISFMYTYGTGFAIGYAVVWPYVSLMMRYMLNSVGDNNQRIRAADYFMTTALEVQSRRPLNEEDISLMRQGVDLLQDMYAEDNHRLPDEFNIPNDQYTMDLARRLHEYSQTNVPLPTRISSSMDFGLNLGLGTIVSTVLGNILSKTLYGNHINSLHLFVYSVAGFAASYLLLKYPGTYVERKVRDFINSREQPPQLDDCEQTLNHARRG